MLWIDTCQVSCWTFSFSSMLSHTKVRMELFKRWRESDMILLYLGYTSLRMSKPHVEQIVQLHYKLPSSATLGSSVTLQNTLHGPSVFFVCIYIYNQI